MCKQSPKTVKVPDVCVTQRPGGAVPPHYANTHTQPELDLNIDTKDQMYEVTDRVHFQLQPHLCRI